MSKLARDGTAKPFSRDQIFRHGRGQEIFIFSVQLTTCRTGNLTRLIHTLAICVTIQYMQKYASQTLDVQLCLLLQQTGITADDIYVCIACSVTTYL